jgi:hypothetical protein
MSLDMLGAESGSDLSSAFSTLLTTGQQAATSFKANSDAKKASVALSAEDGKRADSAIAADQAAVTADAEALYAESVASKDKSGAYQMKAQAARVAANIADGVADRAGEGLSDAAKKRRIDYANGNADRYAKESLAAASASAASPNDATLLDKAQHANMYTLSAQAVALRARGQTPPSNREMEKLAEKPGASLGDGGVMDWFTQRTIISSLPNYGVVAGGAGILGALYYAFKKGFFAKLF